MSGDQPGRTELLAALDQALRKVGALSVVLSETVAARVGMNPTDVESLDFLLTNGPMPAGRLAELTGLTTGAITGVVDRLERLGYARRDPDPADRRRVIVRPLPEKAGREIAPLYEPMARAMDELFARYTDEELAVILDFLTRGSEINADHIARLRAEGAGGKRRGSLETAGREHP